MEKSFTLEICAYNIQSCRIAEKAGAGRIELCADPLSGGTTPGIGLIGQACDAVDIPIFPIIRPRGGNFVYDKDELNIIKKDITFCKQAGCKGISTGIQLANKEIDTENLKRIIEWAYPMQVTCHRVFDVTPDPFKALEDVIACGCTRILTSGQKKTAIEGLPLLAALINIAGERIIIMPGSGVRANNIAQLKKETGAKEFHTSASKPDNGMAYPDKEIINLGGVPVADEREIRNMLLAGR